MNHTRLRTIRLSIVAVLLLITLIGGQRSVLGLPRPQELLDNGPQSNVPERRQSTKEQKSGNNANQRILEVSFKEALPAIEVLQLIGSKQSKVEYLMYRWDEHTGWYFLKADQSLEDALGDFEQKHAEFLTRSINDANENLAITNPQEGSLERSQLEESREKQHQAFLDQLSYLQNNGLLVSGFAVRDNPDTLQSLVEALPTGNVSIRMLPTAERKSEPTAQSRFKIQAASGEPYLGEPWKFSPSSGTISYNASSRRFRSDFFWTDVSGFNSTHLGYEHDITIWSPKNTYVRPGAGTYYSNLPVPYIDSTAFDDDSLFTIGSGAATGIRANHPYYVEVPVQVVNPNKGPSRGDIQPQLGSWAGTYDSGWSSVWEPLEAVYCGTHGGTHASCIFADQTHSINNYYPSDGSNSVGDLPFDHTKSATYSWNKKVMTPRISPGSLSSLGSVTSTISTRTSGAVIRYTTNGADPTSSSPVYTSPLTFTSSVILKARAFKPGLIDSDVDTATYSISNRPGSFTLTATPECNGSSPQIRLNWTTSLGAHTYDVYRNGGLLVSNVAGTQYVNTTVSAGVNYNYNVIAKNSSGSRNSNTTQATAPTSCGASRPGAFTLTATPECSGTTSQIRLNWSSSSGSQNYDIYRNSSLYASNISGTQFINTAVTAGVSYSYFVRAKNAFGSTNSNTVSSTAPSNCGVGRPGAFSLAVTPECNGSSPQLRLNWSGSSGAQAYDVYRNGSLYFSNLTGTQFINTAVSAGVSYTYFIRAKNSAGSTDSNTASGVAPSSCGAVLPGVFTLSLTPECSGSLPQIQLNWTVASSVQSYDVYRNGSLYFSNITGTQFINTAVSAGTSYSYFVRARNSAGTRDSNTTSATAPSTCGGSLPGAFSLAVTPECNGTNPQIRLTWTASNGAHSYDLFRNGSFYTSGITGTQFINTAVTAGTSYSYFVRARNSAGTRDSNSASATAPNCTAISPFLTRFDFTPKPPRAGQNITFQFWGGNFISGQTQVWFFGPGCSSGCQHPAAGVFVISNAYMEARNVRLGAGTYTCYVKNGTSGSLIQAGTVTVSP